MKFALQLRACDVCLLLFFYGWATCSYIFSSPFFSLHRDLLRIGVTLAGHQKKILGSIQDMRLQMNQTLPVQVWATGHTDRYSRRTAGQENGGGTVPERAIGKPKLPDPSLPIRRYETGLQCLWLFFFVCFFFISLPLPFPVPAFLLLIVIVSFFSPSSQNKCVFLKEEDELTPPYTPCVPHQLWCGFDVCMHVCSSEVGLSPATETSHSDPRARVLPFPPWPLNPASMDVVKSECPGVKKKKKKKWINVHT